MTDFEAKLAEAREQYDHSDYSARLCEGFDAAATIAREVFVEKDAKIARLEALNEVLRKQSTASYRNALERGDRFEAALTESRDEIARLRRIIETARDLLHEIFKTPNYEEDADMEANWSAPCNGKSAFHAVPHPMRSGCSEPGERGLPCWRVGAAPKFAAGFYD